MLAYKFTRPQGQGTFTGFRWPLPRAGEPGDWVRAQTADVCVAGVHACRAEQLPHWLGPERTLDLATSVLRAAGLDARAEAATAGAGTAELIALAADVSADVVQDMTSAGWVAERARQARWLAGALALH